MALITCPECGAQVSSAAASCIKCGCPLTKTKICYECKASIAENASVCPNCGHPQNIVRIRVVDDKKTRRHLTQKEEGQWQIYAGGTFKKITLAESKGFTSVDFVLDEPIEAYFRYNYPLWITPKGGSCKIQPGRSYRIYCDGTHMQGLIWVFEEDI